MDKPFALIIEDERDIAALFRHVIDLAGYRTEVAMHGQVAVERLSNTRPDIVILDLNLPGISGNEILAMIRRDSRLIHSKVIVVTAFAHIANSLSAEPDLILLKPISVEQLTNLTKRFLKRGKSQKAKPVENPRDTNTGLYNQPFFMNRLDCALKQSKEIDQYQFAILLLKLVPTDVIKSKTNSQQWESILKDVAVSLTGAVRPTDTIARFDRDNIYVLVENIPNRDIPVMVANRIQDKLNENIAGISTKIQFPIRIGILLCGGGYRDIHEILRDARNAQVLADAQGDEYYKYYYQVSLKK